MKLSSAKLSSSMTNLSRSLGLSQQSSVVVPQTSGQTIYENPPPIEQVATQFRAQRAYVSGENNGIVFYERHKGANTDVVLSMDETGMSVFTIDHKSQSHYAYSNMNNISHTRTANGNFLAIRMKDGERAVFFSKQTDAIKASLVAHLNSHTSIKFGTYQNNYSTRTRAHKSKHRRTYRAPSESEAVWATEYRGSVHVL